MANFFLFVFYTCTGGHKQMQVNLVNNYNVNSSFKNNNNVSFEGFGITKFIPNINVRTKKVQEMIDDDCWRFGNIIGVKTSELKDLTRTANDIRMHFLKSLVTNYNERNFTRAGNLKENPQGLIDTFKTVEYPQLAHFNIVKHTDAPLESLSKLFSVAKDKKSLEFVQNMQHKALGGKKTGVKIITDMLTSKNKQEFLKNPQNYVSYLKFNAKNENAVQELDRMLENGTYDRKIFDAKLAVDSLLKNSAIKATIGDKSKFLEQNYSKSGERFIGHIYSDFLAHKKGLTPDDFSDILNMYKTSTPQNIQTRIDILNKFKYSTAGKGSEASSKEIKSMKQLFDRIDSDQSSAKFVFRILGDDVQTKTIGELNGILDVVPPKKAEIFHKNIARIVRFTDEEERVNALKKELENSDFITEKYAQMLKDSSDAGFTKKESRIVRMARLLENQINKLRYNRTLGESTPTISVEIPQAKVATVIDKPIQTPQLSTSAATKPVIELKRTFKESPQARKLRVQNDVNEIIKQKLGAKTYERQQETYKNGALVMRLKLLPEIFDSIKATRKAQRSAGLRPNVEAADAVKLYSKINGKNRKIVNYMLKQTDDKGERIFSVKDIIKKLDYVEKEIADAKVRNSNFRTSEIKEIYNDEYNYLQYEFGKLKRRRKVA